MSNLFILNIISNVIVNAYNSSIFSMVIQAGAVVKFVLILLLIFSIISWAIIIMKFLLFRRTKKESREFFRIYYEKKRLSSIYTESKGLRKNPFAAIFRESYIELNRITQSNPQHSGQGAQLGTELTGLDSIERTLKRTATFQLNRYERALSFLATTGSTAPFIGLFGTVWGIMDAFRGIGLRGSASLAVVAPGIAEALITTAAGLAAAIPAVVAYNYFVSRTKEIASEMDSFASEFLNVIQRHFIEK
jgi:biopolymer transport protein TolQ